MRPLLSVCVCTLVGLAAVVLQSNERKPQASERKPAVHAAELLELDEKLERAMAREHPDVMPARPRVDPRARAFDWSQHVKGVKPHSQGHTGTCWIQASVAALDYNWRLRNGAADAPDLSPQPIVDRLQTIHGGPEGLAMDMLLKFGTADRKHYPFVAKVERLKENVPTPYRIVGWGRVAVENYPTTAEIKEALARHGPVTAGIYSATEAFHKHRGGGVFREHHQFRQGEPATTHQILIIGWDDGKEAWKIQNSWSTWGEDGIGWVGFGCNHIGHQSEWLRAQSIYYRLPAEAQRLAGDKAAPFPHWPHAREIKLGR